MCIRDRHNAADEIGKVNTIPTIKDTIIPIINGASLVACMIISPKEIIILLINGPIKLAIKIPESTVTIGVTTISIFVSPLIILAISTHIKVATNTPIGPPNLSAPIPTTQDEKSMSLGAFKLYAIDTAIAGPVAAFASGHIVSDKKCILQTFPIVFNIVPTNKVAKRPKAIEPKASIKYTLGERLIPFFLRKFFIFFLLE